MISRARRSEKLLASAGRSPSSTRASSRRKARGIFLERVVAVAKFRERRDEAMARIDLEGTGFCADTPRPEPCEQLFQRAVRAVLGGDEAHRAVGEAVGGAHVGDGVAEGGLDKGHALRDGFGRRGLVFAWARAAASARDRPRPALPSGTACPNDGVSLSTGCRRCRTAAAFRCRGRGSLLGAARPRSGEVVADDVVDRCLVGLEVRDIVLEASPHLGRRGGAETRELEQRSRRSKSS